jgi:hypothetical protein
VGIFNTIFGFICFVVILTLLNAILPDHLLYLTVILASILSTPLNITVAYFGYKFLVVRTKGNYLGEWLKCFAVYGTGMIPGLVALSALTRFLQSLIHSHAASLHVFSVPWNAIWVDTLLWFFSTSRLAKLLPAILPLRS